MREPSNRRPAETETTRTERRVLTLQLDIERGLMRPRHTAGVMPP